MIEHSGLLEVTDLSLFCKYTFRSLLKVIVACQTFEFL